MAAAKGFSRMRSRSSSGDSEATNCGHGAVGGNSVDSPGALKDSPGADAVASSTDDSDPIGIRSGIVESPGVSVGGATSPAISLINRGIGTADLNSEYSGEGVEDDTGDAVTTACDDDDGEQRREQRSPSDSTSAGQRLPASAAAGAEGNSSSGGGSAGRASSSHGTIAIPARIRLPSAGGGGGEGSGEIKRPDEVLHDHQHRHHHSSSGHRGHVSSTIADLTSLATGYGVGTDDQRSSSGGMHYPQEDERVAGVGGTEAWSRVRGRGRSVRHQARIRPTLGPGASPSSTPRNDLK